MKCLVKDLGGSKKEDGYRSLQILVYPGKIVMDARITVQKIVLCMGQIPGFVQEWRRLLGARPAKGQICVIQLF